ncbi:hypothetical protein D3C84_1062950 [compost metagenome]
MPGWETLVPPIRTGRIHRVFQSFDGCRGRQQGISELFQSVIIPLIPGDASGNGGNGKLTDITVGFKCTGGICGTAEAAYYKTEKFLSHINSI